MSEEPDHSNTTLSFLVMAFVVLPGLVIAIAALRPPTYITILAGVVAIVSQVRLVAWYRNMSEDWTDNDGDSGSPWK